jgi:hypothetical protein
VSSLQECDNVLKRLPAITEILGLEVELQILNFMEEISLLLGLSLASRNACLCCHHGARFYFFLF